MLRQGPSDDAHRRGLLQDLLLLSAVGDDEPHAAVVAFTGDERGEPVA
jgi:hypothetical protein